MSKDDKKDDRRYPTWDGSLEDWPEYVKRVRLTWGETKLSDRRYLASILARNLTGPAWKVMVRGRLDHQRLEGKDGVEYLLDYLEENICRQPLPDIGQRLEDFFCPLVTSAGRVNGSMVSSPPQPLSQALPRRAEIQAPHDRGSQATGGPDPEGTREGDATTSHAASPRSGFY